MFSAYLRVWHEQVHELLLELAGVRQQVAARRLSDMAEFRASMDDKLWRDLLQQVSPSPVASGCDVLPPA
jgi:hypothetical protein